MYGAADLAGVSRLQYTTEMRLIRVMCSGRVDLGFVLRAFSNGMDGVFIGGCRFKRMQLCYSRQLPCTQYGASGQKNNGVHGLNPERLTIEFMSGAEANLFVEAVNGFVNKVKELGPLGESEGMDPSQVKAKLAEITKLVPYIKMVNQDKLASRLETPEEHDRLFTAEEIETLFREVVSYYIDPAKCQACSTCLKNCPAEAIAGGKNLIHVIDQEKCIKCGTCLDVCPTKFSSVRKISGEPVPPPIPEEARTITRKSKTKDAAGAPALDMG